MRAIFHLVKQAAQDFDEDEALTRAAALSFYSALSFAPLLILLLWVSALVSDEAQVLIVDQFRELMGPRAGEAVSAVIENAETSVSLGSLSAVIGVLALLFSATGVFAQLQATLNRIWEVKPKPGAGLKNFARTRLLSVGMLGALAFLLMVSLVVSTGIAFVLPDEGPLLRLGSWLASTMVFSLVFAGIYKVVPDCVVRNRDAIIGGLITAGLFALGKEAIGFYLGRGSVGSTYGAAGSLLVLLVWVYYSSIIMLFGAELTQAYAMRYGGGIEPDRHAIATRYREYSRTLTEPKPEPVPAGTVADQPDPDPMVTQPEGGAAREQSLRTG